jgi:diketogulonate reductase-like aldo/keto reductase
MSLIEPSALRIIYGTAWKKDRTKDLVLQAIRTGFRAIDTACQPKHYSEKLVGAAVQEAILSGIVSRSELFLQTKFTSINGQDPTSVPYDPKVPLSEQVRQSLSVSLQHFGTDYLDSLVLHSPMRTMQVNTINIIKIYFITALLRPVVYYESGYNGRLAGF